MPSPGADGAEDAAGRLSVVVLRPLFASFADYSRWPRG